MIVTTWTTENFSTTVQAHMTEIDLGDGRKVKIADGTITVETNHSSFDFEEPDGDGFTHVYYDQAQIAKAY